MNISGNVAFVPSGVPQVTSDSKAVANIYMALQEKGDISVSGTFTGLGIITKTDSNGDFIFNNIPTGEYRVVEAAGYTVNTINDEWNKATSITVTPQDPDVSVIDGVPSDTTNIMSLTPNTVYITVTTSDISDIQFIDSPVANIPLALNTYVTVGKNLIVEGGNGEFGLLPNGTSVQTSPPTANPPYNNFETSFEYVQYGDRLPVDGEYSISNIIDNTNFAVWFNTADHSTGNETGRMMVVNGGHPDQSIFTTQVTVKANTDYVFSTWILNLDALTGYINPELRVIISGSEDIFNKLLTQNLGLTSIPTWKQVGAVFNSASNTVLTVSFISEGGPAYGNDYLIDDIRLEELEGTPVTDIQKNVNRVICEPGDKLTYTITFTNTSSQTLKEVLFVDPLSSDVNLQVDSVIVNNVQVNSPLLSEGIVLKDIGPKQSINIQFVVQVATNLKNGTTIYNTGTLKYTFIDMENNTRRVVVNTNEVNTTIINSTCPICPTGATGPRGEQGVTGATGPRGEQGVTGATGPRGEQGVTGATGSQGEKGSTGATGLQGEQGVTGATGSQGEQGVTGATGSQGEQGVTGATGSQGEQGVTGATGPQGEKGSTGVTGPQGEKGSTGVTGPPGEKGSTGATGPQGPTGPAGKDAIRDYLYICAEKNMCVKCYETVPLLDKIVSRGDSIKYIMGKNQIVLESNRSYYVHCTIFVLPGIARCKTSIQISFLVNSRKYPGMYCQPISRKTEKFNFIGDTIIRTDDKESIFSLSNQSCENICIEYINLMILEI
ncbi:DUF11 domain-containing protein [Niameybacter massiliensis]|uniref:DUF11 domain-containing protein n=1 Tax=Niameybacter massiliensis TaxID=1658108 RepID=UPI0006B56278|nr:DUF11 domain-containing protein [Niameybacter massiliensis]